MTEPGLSPDERRRQVRASWAWYARQAEIHSGEAEACVAEMERLGREMIASGIDPNPEPAA